VKQLKRNRPGMMINTVNLSEKFYDPMEGLRESAIRGILTNRVKS
jgi:hypothetical protein